MIGFPFDSYVTFDTHGEPEYDRAISAQPLKNLIHRLFSDGILPDISTNLQVVAGESGMTVTVKVGFCIIQGGLKLEENERTLSIQAADSNYSRIDSVIMRWNDNVDYRECDLYVIQGTAAANPVRPELTREGGIYELGLADILIPAQSTTISNERITDTRYESARCGVISSISEFDTTFIYNQVQSDLATFQSGAESDFTTWATNQQSAYEEWIFNAESAFGNWENDEKDAFLAWFATLQDILDENVAGHLQNEIDGLDNRLTTVEGTIGSYDSQISGLGDRMTAVEGDVGTLQTSIGTAQGDISALQTATANNTEELRVIENTIELTISTWSSSTYTVNGIAYYRSVSANAYTVLSNKILEMLLIPTSTSYPLPSQTEIDDYNKIDFMTYNDEDNKIYWYAKEKPSANVKVKIIGIKNVITS